MRPGTLGTSILRCAHGRPSGRERRLQFTSGAIMKDRVETGLAYGVCESLISGDTSISALSAMPTSRSSGRQQRLFFARVPVSRDERAIGLPPIVRDMRDKGRVVGEAGVVGQDHLQGAVQ